VQHRLFDGQCFGIIPANFKFYHDKYQARLVAWVRMTNHLPFVIYFGAESTLSDYMRDFKKNTSGQISQSLAEKAPEKLAGISCPPRTQHVKVGEDVFDGVPRYTRKICEKK